MVGPSKNPTTHESQKKRFGNPVPAKNCQSSARACTHKSGSASVAQCLLCPESDLIAAGGETTRCASRVLRHRNKPLLDHLINARKELGWYGQTERPGSLHIEDQFEDGWLLDRQVGRPGTFQDFVNIRRSLAKKVYISRGVGHQPAFLGEPAWHRNRRHTMLQRKVGGAFAR